ncbi:unnamed protein product [Euphydryas editha]|uniref:trypsin n=1 Tax=Euphydryas editha TaxID=104508 RepID=A0AAU9UM51_EUPED|nr:unnamed protein product [Euphydryas editha]
MNASANTNNYNTKNNSIKTKDSESGKKPFYNFCYNNNTERKRPDTPTFADIVKTKVDVHSEESTLNLLKTDARSTPRAIKSQSRNGQVKTKEKNTEMNESSANAKETDERDDKVKFSELFIRILGGSDISIEQAAYSVNYGDICGGVLLHKKWVLTAAHCGIESTYIRVGTRHRLGGLKIKIKNHIIHPLYQKDHTFDYDVQLLELYRQLRFGETVNNIAISSGEFEEHINIAGWGYGMEKGDYKDILQQVKIPVVPFEKCQKVDQPWYNNTLTSRMFCAGGKNGDACQGDSGSGAVSNGRLIGISSFGFGCGRVPGVYINVSRPYIREWLRRYTGV